ncbi:hypothetical protein AHAS_Ahas19G0149800 [Arachis hypogaea]
MLQVGFSSSDEDESTDFKFGSPGGEAITRSQDKPIKGEGFAQFVRLRGFDVRKGDVGCVNGVLVRRDFFCHWQGTRSLKQYDRPDRIKEERLEHWTDCKAKLKIYLDVDSMKQFGITTSKVMAYIAGKSGSYGMLKFTKRDPYNYVHKQRRARISDGDAIQPLVLAFDSTYRENKYKKPLVVFSGVNHHRKACIFAFTLVEDEEFRTYRGSRMWNFCKVFKKAIYANFEPHEPHEFELYWQMSVESLGLVDHEGHANNNVTRMGMKQHALIHGLASLKLNL